MIRRLRLRRLRLRPLRLRPLRLRPLRLRPLRLTLTRLRTFASLHTDVTTTDAQTQFLRSVSIIEK